jgi:hypothetical protein
MKSPGTIYRRYRQLKRKTIFEKIQETRKKAAKNCIYGKSLDILDKNKTLHCFVCLYNKNINAGLDICNHPEDCNAFICKYTKEDIENSFYKDLKDITTFNKKYPEIALLEWVLDKTLEDAKKEPTPLVKLAVYLINLLEDLIRITAKDQKRLMSDK